MVFPRSTARILIPLEFVEMFTDLRQLFGISRHFRSHSGSGVQARGAVALMSFSAVVHPIVDPEGTVTKSSHEAAGAGVDTEGTVVTKSLHEAVR